MGSLDEWLLPASAGTKTGLSIAQVNEYGKRLEFVQDGKS